MKETDCLLMQTHEFTVESHTKDVLTQIQIGLVALFDLANIEALQVIHLGSPSTVTERSFTVHPHLFDCHIKVGKH